jgi:replicative DNA helicase
MQYGTLLLSKVIDNNDVAALKRFGVEESHFATEAERKAYRFIVDYAEQNRNQAPSYATVVAEIDGFDYVPAVEDSYEYLTKQLKSHAAKMDVIRLFNGDPENPRKQPLATKKFEELDGHSYLDWLISEIERVKMRTDVRLKVGTSVKTDIDSFLSEYRERKAGKSFRVWKSKFPSINDEIGGYLSGNMYTWYGRSGRGKSVFAMEEALEAAIQGARVLVWAMEMSRFEWMARAYSSISARQGIVSATIDGVDYEAGFENKALLMGRLTEEFEKGFEVFLYRLAEGEYMSGDIILRAADDEDFMKRDVKQLEADIIATKADVVVIDPIYLMDYEANTSKTAGGDVANTSKKIRRIAGYTNTTIHVITQADEVKDDTDENGNREIRPPKRAEIKKTKSVLEDAANVFGIDTCDGRGMIEIGKGRNGGEGAQIEVVYMPNFGIVREMETGEAVAQKYGF